jgi:SAM-dependent methyltransferase
MAIRQKLTTLISEAPKDGKVLDVGCAGLRVAVASTNMGRTDLQQAGIDYGNPVAAIPDNFDFRTADLNVDALPFGDDSFDLVVASHVLEHITNPIRFFSELVRVTAPGGRIYVEAPSERSILMPGMWFSFEKANSLSFYDDPTHVGRPWPPQALDRLARCFQCIPEDAGYHQEGGRLRQFYRMIRAIIIKRTDYLEDALWNLVGWASFVIVRKPANMRGAPQFQYYLPLNKVSV